MRLFAKYEPPPYEDTIFGHMERVLQTMLDDIEDLKRRVAALEHDG